MSTTKAIESRRINGIKVFVSSTFIDLKQHRRAVDQILSRLKVQYRGMEFFGSRPAEPKSVSFEEINECQVFLGIYAHRYGWIPNGDSLSITEQEFDLALRLGLDCYCYVADPHHPWSPSLIDRENGSKLETFMDKVKGLVRSTFTTPDNLAKQVAADLKLAVGKSTKTVRGQKLLDTLNIHVNREIQTTIGRKYIRDLYIDRVLGDTITSSTNRLSEISSSIRLIRPECESLQSLLGIMEVSHLNSDQKKVFDDSKIEVSRATEIFEELERLVFPNEELCYPADRLNRSLSSVRKGILNAQRHDLDKSFDNTNSSNEWQATVSSLLESTLRLERSLRPISLVVDRAGGGKTNLLCRLAEDLACVYPVFFVAAKAVPHANDKAIIDYLASAYPIGEDPLQTALISLDHPTPVILILDGINEHVEPGSFNAAFKAFVRRYYGQPVLYIVSCRDIYWRYFEDDWWANHCALTSRDELYEFSKKEFKQALPLYLRAYDIEANPVGNAREQLHHPLLLRFYCEAFKGLPHKQTKIGRIADIRLFDLFEVYCQTKFRQIKDRLGLLSVDEVFDYLHVIARMMLSSHARALPIRAVTKELKEVFGEPTNRSLRTMYVQILDEDILLEQKPTGLEMSLLVSFVYEEFMEYVIAKAMWSELVASSELDYEKIEIAASELLRKKDIFISVLGVIVYLGEMLAVNSRVHLNRYIDWLTLQQEETLVCKLLTRVKDKSVDNSMYAKLIAFHKNGRNAQIKREAWRALEKTSLPNWPLFFDYIVNLELRKTQSPMSVFAALGRLKGGPTSEDQIATLRWIADLISEGAYLLRGKQSSDYRSASSAVRQIVAAGRSTWDEATLKTIEPLIVRID